MLCRKPGWDLIHIAIDLTRIAVFTALRGLLRSPGGRRAAEPALESARESFRRTKTYRQRRVQNRRARLGRKPHGRDFDPAAAQVVAQRLAHPRSKNSVEMEWRKMRDVGERVEIERLVEMPIDVRNHPVHALLELRAVILRRHTAPDAQATTPRPDACGRTRGQASISPQLSE